MLQTRRILRPALCSSHNKITLVSLLWSLFVDLPQWELALLSPESSLWILKCFPSFVKNACGASGTWASLWMENRAVIHGSGTTMERDHTKEWKGLSGLLPSREENRKIIILILRTRCLSVTITWRNSCGVVQSFMPATQSLSMWERTLLRCERAQFSEDCT